MALPDRTARVMLSRVLQVLAREGVPLTAPSVVLTAMQRGRRGAVVLEIAAAVRRQLRPALPGNAPGTRLVVVPQILEDRLARGLYKEDGAVYWELPLDQTVQLVDALRAIDREPLDHPSTALVVRSGELRPFVWRLLAPEFPFLSVLCEEERIDQP
jgi:flagellar biosynthesis component FlhA